MKTANRGGEKGCKDRMIKEEERTDGKAEEKNRTREECQLADMLCSLRVLCSK